jgi:hypothetical protein
MPVLRFVIGSVLYELIESCMSNCEQDATTPHFIRGQARKGH